ncbi:hypothetical protein Tco_1314501 [Tanacetum coccineum]
MINACASCGVVLYNAYGNLYAYDRFLALGEFGGIHVNLGYLDKETDKDYGAYTKFLENRANRVLERRSRSILCGVKDVNRLNSV